MYRVRIKDLFMENPEKTWNDFLAKEMQKAPQNQVFD